MTIQPAHDRLDRRPFWTVQVVFDPDGGGAEFAYTMGLHERGLPELHMWGRPDRGDDPGADWMFSHSDRCTLLNEFAWELIDGKLRVGDERTKTYDAGQVSAHFRVEPPGDRASLETFGTHPDSTVWPISWALIRPPEGPPRPLDPAARARAKREYDAIVARLPRDQPAGLPPEWRLPETPSFAMDQIFGPRTPILLARAAQLSLANVAELNQLMHGALSVHLHLSLTFPTSVAKAAARRSGRRPAMEAMVSAMEGLIDWFVDGVENKERWTDLLISLYGRQDLTDPGIREEADRHTRHLLHDLMAGCLAVELAADVMDSEWVVAGRGPFAMVLDASEGQLPGREWVAADAVLDAVSDLLRPLSLDQWIEIASRHATARNGHADRWTGYTDLFPVLQAWSLYGAAACPWEPTLAQLPAADLGRVAARGGEVVFHLAPVHAIQEWASVFAAALTHRGRLTSEQVDEFVAPFHDLLPTLHLVLNRPIALAG